MSVPFIAMAPAFSHRAFANSDGAFTGTCPVADETPRFTLAKRTTADEDSPRWPAQLQIFDGGSGILQTVDGWFPVKRYGEAANAVWNRKDNRKCATGGTGRAAKRNDQRRLMDYNNDPSTTIDDVRSAFQEALRRASDPMWLSRHGFAD